MSIFESLVLGLVQGLTEFLPISSSGHLVLFSGLFKLEESSQLLFFAMLHVATLVAVLLFFFRDLIKLRLKDYWIIGIGTVPALIIGLLFKDFLESLFVLPVLNSVTLVITGLINIAADKKMQTLPKESPVKSTLTPGWKQAIAVGIAQAISIIPGISRSGSTVATGVFMNMPRTQAFKFSFFLSIPAILGASLLEIVDHISQTQSFSLTVAEWLGLFAAFVGGLLSLKLFSLVIHKAQLKWFGYYVIIVGILSGLYFFFL
jgi:undecaprenyl-diphosphatase